MKLRLHPPTLRGWRSITGLIIGVYVLMHLCNHGLGLISLQAQESARPWVMLFWQTWLGQGLLYGSIAFHAALGLSSICRRRHYRMPSWERWQILAGLAIPYLLLVHIANTRGTRITAGIDIGYEYEIANLWVEPWTRLKQVALVLLVWTHFVMGLHFWLRHRLWYRRVFHGIFLAYVLVPLTSLLGFAQVGMQMTRQARSNPDWYREISSRGVPALAAQSKLRSEIRKWAGPGWLALVAAVLAYAQIRNWLQRHRQFSVTYPDRAVVNAEIGMSVLEVSRLGSRPHMSVCGGRARCTTCRVWILSSERELPPPASMEQQALTRIGAPRLLRLACQLRPSGNLTVCPLLNPSLVSDGANAATQAHEFGEEQVITVLFMDVRGSTQLAEGRLPYDVVFLMNHFFAAMAEAVEGAGGHYSNFTGDGLMAIFGLNSSPRRGARAAMACALGMYEKLAEVNTRLADELGSPISVGIGIHSGEAIVGKMGPPKTPILSALGDTVNTTARLEGLTKELQAPVVVSYATIAMAEIEAKLPMREVLLRGRSQPIRIAPLDVDAISLCLLELKTQPHPKPSIFQKPVGSD
jgi:adenylate cyclase